jgi:hypothetical protein
MRKVLMGFTLTALLVAPALADRISFKAAKVSINVPDGWKSSTDGDTISISDKHEDVNISFMAVDAGAVKQATKALKRMLEKKVDHLTLTDPSKISFNGMDGVVLSGDGFVNDVNIDLAIVVLDTPSDTNDLVVFAIGEDAKLARHKDEVMSIFENLKPLGH